LTREYRELSRGIPVKAHLGEELTKEEFDAALSAIYQYIDLTNEQIFLRINGRIYKATWDNWVDGIQANFRRPAFKQAWAYIQEHSKGSFDELRRLEKDGFSGDPRKSG
jgi:hypothetical protein